MSEPVRQHYEYATTGKANGGTSGGVSGGGVAKTNTADSPKPVSKTPQKNA